MDAAFFELPFRMAPPAYERGLRQIGHFALKRPLRVLVRGEIGMALRTGKGSVDGRIEFCGIDIGFHDFVILECHHVPVLRMTG